MNTQLRFLLLSATLFLASCTLIPVPGSGNVITQPREVAHFERIELCCGMQLVFSQATPAQVSIEADDTIVEQIETSVQNETLQVGFRSTVSRARVRTLNAIIVRVQTPTIQSINIAGGSSLLAEQIESEQLALKFNGGSRAEIGTLLSSGVTIEAAGGTHLTIDTIAADTLVVELHGGTRLTIQEGTLTEQQITAAGGSHYRAADVQSTSAAVDLGGSSKAELWVTTALQVKASGGSQVEYSGTPTVDQELSGGSRVVANTR